MKTISPACDLAFAPAALGLSPAPFAERATRGYSLADLTGIARGNILRVMRGVESNAERIAKKQK